MAHGGEIVNTKKRIFIIILLAVFTICCYITSFIVLRESLNPHGKYSPDENYVKSYNENSNVQLFNNKLYVTKPHYSGEIVSGGLYEVDSNGSRLVLDFEKSGLQDRNVEFIPFKNNLIVMDYYFSEENDNSFFENTIYKLDTKKRKLQKLSELKDISYIETYFTDKNTLYLISDNKLYASYDAVNTKQVFDFNRIQEDSDYCIDNGSIYYISKDHYITQDSLNDDKILLRKKIPKTVTHKNNTFSIYKIGNNILFENYYNDDESDDEVKTDIFNVNNNFKKIYSSFDSYDSICGYNDKLFISSLNEDAIHSINIKNGKSKKIFNDENHDISVFGDKWLYFTDSNNNLHRIPQDGKKVEMILG